MVLDFIEKNFDDYNRKARLTPALLVSLPIVLSMIAFFPEQVLSWSGLLTVLAWFGVLKFLAQLARNMGVNKQSELYEEWGGKPTTYFLRHRSTRNKVELARRHSKLQELTGQSMPTLENELADPDLADQTYDTCVKFLLSKTRDHSKFSLLYEENCNYGFRRNLLGMKPYGITLSLIGTLFLVGQCAFVIDLFHSLSTLQMRGLIQTIMSLQFSKCSSLSIACLLLNIFILAAWMSWINSAWVRNSAEAYADRLLETSENLS
jgi:hypothetical protein